MNKLMVISGPSGSGKGTVVELLKKKYEEVYMNCKKALEIKTNKMDNYLYTLQRRRDKNIIYDFKYFINTEKYDKIIISDDYFLNCLF